MEWLKSNPRKKYFGLNSQVVKKHPGFEKLGFHCSLFIFVDEKK